MQLVADGLTTCQVRNFSQSKFWWNTDILQIQYVTLFLLLYPRIFLPLSTPWGKSRISIPIKTWRICQTCTVNNTSDHTLWTLYRSYFKGISANIELQVYSVMYCWSNLLCVTVIAHDIHNHHIIHSTKQSRFSLSVPMYA
jgi:hypothetical protein